MIIGFTLNTGPRGTKIADLEDGSIVYLNNTKPGFGLTVVAHSSVEISRVQMECNNKPKYRTERTAPYTLCGGFPYFACNDLKVGIHTVTATPRGGTAKKVTLEIKAGFPPPTPLPPPSSGPTTFFYVSPHGVVLCASSCTLGSASPACSKKGCTNGPSCCRTLVKVPMFASALCSKVTKSAESKSNCQEGGPWCQGTDADHG
jgi:hypothetical protein